MVMDTQTGMQPSPPENGNNEPAERNIDKNSSDEYDEDTSPKLGSRMSDTLELDDSANLDQAIRKINENGSKMDKLSYKICHTSSPFSFEKNISEMHKYLEKLDQSSIHSTASDIEMCANEVNVSDRTPNVPSRAALLEFERLRQEFKQQIDALRQELMSKNEAKMSNGLNDVRAVSGTINWSEGESSSKIGSFIEESENRQLAECREIIENTPVLPGSLPCKIKRGLRENTEKDLSNLEASVEHCNAFDETRDKPEASNESSKNAHDMDVTLQTQATEKQSEVHQIQSLQDDNSAQNHFSANLKEENEHPDSAEVMNLPHGNRNKAKDESKPAFEHRIKTALFCLSVTLLLGLAFFGLVWLGIGLKHKFSAQENLKGLTYISKASIEREMEDLQKSLDAEIKLRRKTESDLKLAQGNLEELRRDKDKAENDLKRNLDELAHYKAKSQREMEKLRNNLDAEIEQRRKTESDLKLAQGNVKGFAYDKASIQRKVEDLQNSLDAEIEERRKAEGKLNLAQWNLEELRRDKDKAENGPTRVAWICCTLFIVAVLVLGVFCARFSNVKHELSSEIERRSKAEGELKLAQKNLEGMRLYKAKAENATKD